jgi:hypothetical protein
MRDVLVVLCALSVAALVSCGESARVDPISAPLVQVFKSPTCGCCVKWAEHLMVSGFEVKASDVDDLNPVKRQHGVPSDSESCHTALVDGYVIEGHVPASDIQRLLRERPAVRGLVVPGMPHGSPGMESPTPEPYTVYAFDETGSRSVFSRHD